MDESRMDVDALHDKIGRLEVEREFSAMKPGVISLQNRDAR
ncbi:hypothetical protein SAMN02745225_01918 [Ferrithrix thermotolerans DSM 19514]|uniref:Uncharacterized protein n=1 Tax=Ferrithrix thermotolerans DSM 19514 TaxID=1121881 RepID=A0A1M4X722_9ACTN|nr:hypothetical protein SAMN02745225_01918 [Ferrithrix thermotolerans DSM 19514]